MNKVNNLILPISINSDIKERTEILPNVFLSELTKTEQTEYFNILPDEDGISGVCISSNDSVQPDPIALGFRLGCSHKINCIETELTVIINSLRLLKTSNFGIKYIRGDKYKDLPNLPCCLFIPKLHFEIADIPNLNRIYKLLKQNNNLILNKILERYELILGENGIPTDIKFKELITILEMIYLPNEKYQITKKFAKRISIILQQFYQNLQTKNFYEYIKENYEIRSRLAHAGIMDYDFENKDKERFLRLLDITRLSILLFLKHTLMFNEENLKNIDLIKE